MTRAAKLLSVRETVPPLEIEGVELPPPLAPITRSETASLAAAGALHLALFLSVLAPERRLGIGGLEMEAIGVEIVATAPALEARSTARGRGEAGARQEVAEQDGNAEPVVQETGAQDSRRDEQPQPSATAAPPADLVVPDWEEKPPTADLPPLEPIIARAKGEAREQDVPESEAPKLPDPQMQSSVDSRSAMDVLARFRGGAASRGREPTETPAIVMAAARAGLRNEFQLEVFKAILANPPRRVPGAKGQVKVEFAVLRDGSMGQIRIARSSGNRQLDEAALTAVRAARVRPPPSDLDDAALLFDMPFTFQ